MSECVCAPPLTLTLTLTHSLTHSLTLTLTLTLTIKVTAWLAKCIDDVLSVSSERSLNNLREKLLSRNLECSDLADVDLNGDGKISRYE